MEGKSNEKTELFINICRFTHIIA